MPITPVCQSSPFKTMTLWSLKFISLSILDIASFKVAPSILCLSRFASFNFFASAPAFSSSSVSKSSTALPAEPILPDAFILGPNIKPISKDPGSLFFNPLASIRALTPLLELPFLSCFNPSFTRILFSPTSGATSETVPSDTRSRCFHASLILNSAHRTSHNLNAIETPERSLSG